MNTIFSNQLIQRDKDNKSLIKIKNPKNPKGNILTKSSLLYNKFAQLYIKHNFNATKAYMELYPSSNSNTASSSGYSLLQQPRVKELIVNIINSCDIRELKVISQAIETKNPDTISWKDKHSFIRTSLELKGRLNKDKSNKQVNIALVVSK